MVLSLVCADCEDAHPTRQDFTRPCSLRGKSSTNATKLVSLQCGNGPATKTGE